MKSSSDQRATPCVSMRGMVLRPSRASPERSLKSWACPLKIWLVRKKSLRHSHALTVTVKIEPLTNMALMDIKLRGWWCPVSDNIRLIGDTIYTWKRLPDNIGRSPTIAHITYGTYRALCHRICGQSILIIKPRRSEVDKTNKGQPMVNTQRDRYCDHEVVEGLTTLQRDSTTSKWSIWLAELVLFNSHQLYACSNKCRSKVDNTQTWFLICRNMSVTLCIP